MTLYNVNGYPIEEVYEPLIADVFPRIGWSIDPVQGSDFEQGEDAWGAVLAIDMACHAGYRIPEDILAPVEKEMKALIDCGLTSNGEAGLMYIERNRALDNTTA